MKSPEQQPTRQQGLLFFLWRNMPRFLLIAMLIISVLLFVDINEKRSRIADQKAKALAEERPEINTITLELRPQTITDRINLPGATEPWTDLELRSKINGTIEKVFVAEGNTIAQGAPIAQVEKIDYRIALDRAQAAYDLAKANYLRDTAIYKKKMLAKAALEARKTALAVAKADLANARLQFSRCTITSPIAGVIQHLDATVGLQLHIGTSVARILKTDKLKAVIGIPESDVNAVARLDNIDISIQALGDKTITAKKHYLSAMPKNLARLYELELEVENTDGTILPGMFVRGDIVKKTVPNAIAIPFYSVISRNDEQFVYVEQDGIARKRKVQLGIMEEWLVEIVAGLAPGEHLIVEGHRNIEDGQKIRVIKQLRSAKDLRL